MDNENKKIMNQFTFDPSNTDGIRFGDDYRIDGNDESKILPDIRQVNIFIGTNNAGKSRIIRAIFSQKSIKLDNPRLKNLIQKANELRSTAQQKNTNSENGISRLKEISIERLEENIQHNRSNIDQFLDGLPPTSITGGKDEALKLRDLYNKLTSDLEPECKYIPILRGLREMDFEHRQDYKKGSTRDIYSERTIRDHFKSTFVTTDYHTHKKIFTGQKVYNELVKKLLGNREDRDSVKKYEEFLSEHFFEGKEVTITPKEGEDNIILYVQDEHERAIPQLGDGIQAIITITYPIFLSSSNELEIYCIEEPELYLHPAMQRKLVEVMLLDQFSNKQFFITTHTNHFIDLFFEQENRKKMAIFSVTQKSTEKDDGTKAKIKFIKPLTEFSEVVYDELGAKPSSLLLANKSIWVEGISDRIYIRKGIELYKEKYKEKAIDEDYDYTFMEYGGSNLAHYLDSEDDLDITKIANKKNIFLIVDKDDTELKQQSKKAERYEILAEQFGAKRFKVTDGREMENYIKPEILKKVWVTLDCKFEDYKDQKLGKFIMKKGITELRIDKYGNLKRKAGLAKKITEEQKNWDDLSPDFQKLITKLVKFIKE